MRKLKLQAQVSVDGFVGGPNGELDWMTWNLDEQAIDVITSITDSCDTILLGRKMTDGFIKYWESVKPESPEFTFAEKMVNYPKIVFSKTLKTVPGKNVSVENGDMATAVKALKNKPGKDIVVYGGANFVSGLLKEGLIDEFNLFVNPVMIGKGIRIYDMLDKKQKLGLISATGYECGVSILRYNLV